MKTVFFALLSLMVFSSTSFPDIPVSIPDLNITWQRANLWVAGHLHSDPISCMARALCDGNGCPSDDNSMTKHDPMYPGNILIEHPVLEIAPIDNNPHPRDDVDLAWYVNLVTTLNNQVVRYRIHNVPQYVCH